MKYFSIEELCKSETADKLGIKNVPCESEKINLVSLVDNVLDPLREKYGKPIKVNSGYRCLKLNKAVGSKQGSQHVKGEAVDITAGSKSENVKLFEILRLMDFDQLINEKDFSWIHVSYKKCPNRKQILAL